MSLLSLHDVVVEFDSRVGPVRALDGVSLDVAEGETLALLGESGSGKSVTAQAILGLLPRPAGRIAAGRITFDGTELTTASARRMRAVRGGEISMVFQDPLSSLNPVHPIGRQIGETLRVHRGLSKAKARAEALDLMRRVGIPDPARRIDDYPHQLSGGMRQRIMIAIAIALRPRLIIADEPTTALDVTVQAQILQLLSELQRDYRMALILISHDLGVVAAHASRIAVMYAGRIVETGPLRQVYENPAHPYTRSLLQSVPTLTAPTARLTPIPGTPPSPEALPPGCPFHPRCAWRVDLCTQQRPTLEVLSTVDGPGRAAACHRSEEVRDDA
ncbi:MULTISPECIES: ABC transporter ATP-binding protein [unclassified Micromonospora]|uniref:ABC transporter ATP-binding protein n=1 Tax=unclassified Micromonospora TaxID=2617518 RepID=UPI0010348C20|nr:ABC transporter ATP-binding protein [Verrucosispora sp. SN26_14.1]TBL41769.1 ABC transporter ATP-binding protein [Verrucosispora sp. SN26_14.1]